jgi:hypothetical protein
MDDNEQHFVESELQTPHGRIVAVALHDLSQERLEQLAKRGRELLEEQRREGPG